MAITGKLTARAIKTTKAGRYNDGGNLWLTVRKDKSRYWSFRYTFEERRREMGLGAADVVSVAKARADAREAKLLLKSGIDPVVKKHEDDGKKKTRVPTFKECALAFIKSHEAGWSNPKHRYQWKATLEQFAYPAIGSKRVDRITVADVLSVIEPLWTTKTETATRLRMRIEKVLDWAKVRSYRDGDNPALWKGNLESQLPARTKVHTVIHLKSLPYADVGAFMRELRTKEGMAARALELCILTASRPGMVRLAEWSEFDLDAGTWTIPAAHMKSRREFRVALSDQAVRLVRSLPVVDGSECLFPNAEGKPLSDMALTALLRRMEVPVTAHGFRSTFKDWATETTAFQNMVSEMALAHSIGSKTEEAYRRGDLFDKRRALMKAWGDYCDAVQVKTTATVTAIGAGR